MSAPNTILDNLFWEVFSFSLRPRRIESDRSDRDGLGSFLAYLEWWWNRFVETTFLASEDSRRSYGKDIFQQLETGIFLETSAILLRRGLHSLYQ